MTVWPGGGGRRARDKTRHESIQEDFKTVNGAECVTALDRNVKGRKDVLGVADLGNRWVVAPVTNTGHAGRRQMGRTVEGQLWTS